MKSEAQEWPCKDSDRDRTRIYWTGIYKKKDFPGLLGNRDYELT